MGNENEQDRVRQIMNNLAAGKQMANKPLVFDKVNKTIRPAHANEDFTQALQMTPEDALVGASIQ